MKLKNRVRSFVLVPVATVLAGNIRTFMEQWEVLGVLQRSPVKKELEAILKKHAE